jgi:hypothetical protein
MRNATGITDTVISYDIDTVGGQVEVACGQNGQATVVGLHQWINHGKLSTRLRPDVFEFQMEGRRRMIK